MHESRLTRITVYLDEEVIGWVHHASHNETPYPPNKPWFAIAKHGTVPIRYFGMLDSAVNEVVLAHESRTHLANVKEEANSILTTAINDLHDQLFRAGVLDLVVESLLESHIDVNGFRNSINTMDHTDVERPPA